MSLENDIANRRISQLLHFTTNRGSLGILTSKALKPRSELAQDRQLEKIFYHNAADRSRDAAWHGYVNLSISNINERFFGICAENWHRDKDFWWAVFSLRPEIMLHDGVYFTTTNNMYSGVNRDVGQKGFASLFAPTVQQWSGKVVARQADTPPQVPTCNQAEVLYPGALSTSHVQCIYVRSNEYADELAGQMAMSGHPPIEIVVNPSIFGH